MIPPRDAPVNHFDLVRWARSQAVESNLRQVEAHVLLLLATYADKEANAWPSIRTLACQAGLKPNSDGRNSAISAAISRLEELQLVWSTQRGHGKTANRELLFDPRNHGSKSASGQSAQATAGAELAPPSRPGEPSGPREAQPSAPAEPKDQRKSQPTRTRKEDARGSHPASRTASHPATRKENDGGRRPGGPRPIRDVLADAFPNGIDSA